MPLEINSLVTYIHETLYKDHDVAKLKLSPIYGETVRLYDKVKIHCDITEVPKEILLRKFPNETDEEYDYRVKNYEPVTPSFWNKAIGTVNRIWNKQNYSIEWKDSEQGEYFVTDYPVYGSLEVFFKSIVTNQKINDPNSVLAIKPFQIPVKEDSEGNYVADQSKEISPFCYIYCSKDIMFYEEDQALVLSEEKSEIQTNINEKKKEGLVFNLYDEEYIYRIYQVGKQEDYNFESEIYYQHGLGYMPVWKLKGFPVYYENALLYHSYFIGALPLLNKAVSMDTTLDVCLAKFTYPMRAYAYEPCTAPGCDHGKVLTYVDGAACHVPCKSCNGTGDKNYKFSPHRDWKYRTPDPNFEAGSQVPFPGFEFIEPPTNNMDWTYKTVYDLIVKGFAFLNIDVSNSDVKGSETALGKKIDREELMSFLMLFSTEIFHLLKEVISAIGEMRYQNFTEPVVGPPTEFSIKNASDLTEEYAKAQESHLPSYMQLGIMNDFVKQRFGQDEFTTRLNQIISLADPYITFSNDDIIGRKGAGIIDTWQVILHDSISLFVHQKLTEDEKYLEKKDMEIVADLEAMAKEKANLLPSKQLGSTQSILGNLAVA